MTVSPAQADIETALRTFLIAVVGSSVPVVKGQTNRVPEPSESNFIVFWVMSRERIATNNDTYDNVATQNIEQSGQVTFQIDVHGPSSADNAQAITTLFRDDFGYQNFTSSNPAITPLHADNPRQMPYINAEDQYEDRWIIDGVIQADQTLSIPAQFANQVTINSVVNTSTLPP
jgi:hypothetical protein